MVILYTSYKASTRLSSLSPPVAILAVEHHLPLDVQTLARHQVPELGARFLVSDDLQHLGPVGDELNLLCKLLPPGLVPFKLAGEVVGVLLIEVVRHEHPDETANIPPAAQLREQVQALLKLGVDRARATAGDGRRRLRLLHLREPIVGDRLQPGFAQPLTRGALRHSAPVRSLLLSHPDLFASRARRAWGDEPTIYFRRLVRSVCKFPLVIC